MVVVSRSINGYDDDVDQSIKHLLQCTSHRTCCQHNGAVHSNLVRNGPVSMLPSNLILIFCTTSRQNQDSVHLRNVAFKLEAIGNGCSNLFILSVRRDRPFVVSPRIDWECSWHRRVYDQCSTSSEQQANKAIDYCAVTINRPVCPSEYSGHGCTNETGTVNKAQAVHRNFNENKLKLINDCGCCCCHCPTIIH